MSCAVAVVVVVVGFVVFVVSFEFDIGLDSMWLRGREGEKGMRWERVSE